MLNDRVIPFFDEQEVPLLRILTDRETEFCGSIENSRELFLSVEGVEHSKTKAYSPQTNGICDILVRKGTRLHEADQLWWYT